MCPRFAIPGTKGLPRSWPPAKPADAAYVLAGYGARLNASQDIQKRVVEMSVMSRYTRLRADVLPVCTTRLASINS